MPTYRINGSGIAKNLAAIYRINGSGVAKKLSKIYRINGSGVAKVIFSSSGPVEITAATLKNQIDSTTDFYGGDTLSLTRGSYTLTNNATQYRLTIYKGLTEGAIINDSNWTVASRSTYTGSTSTATTAITYSLTDLDAKYPSYYLVGEVRVTIGSTNYFFYTPYKVLSRVSLIAQNLTNTGVTDNDATFSWEVNGIGGDSTYISEQVLTTRQSNQFGTIVDTASIANGKLTDIARAYGILNGLTALTNYYSEIVVTANDSWKNTASPTTSFSAVYFSTLAAAPADFSYTILNQGTVTTPSTPTQTRQSSTSNNVWIEIASSKPADTDEYQIKIWGSGANVVSSEASPFTQSLSVLNTYTGQADSFIDIASTASNSPINIYTIAIGTKREIYANVSTTSGAQSWRINFQWSGSSPSAVTYYNNGTGTLSSATSGTVNLNTNSMPVKLAEITGPANPNLYINSITAYSGTGQTGTSTAGTAGTPTTIASATRPTATSGTSTANYTYYAAVAPSGGVVGTPTLLTQPITAGRVDAIYSVNITTEASGTPTPTKSYQWQVFTTSWVNITGATSTTYTVPYTASTSSGTQVIPSRSIRCEVTWTNSAGSQTNGGGSVAISSPTITGVTASLSTSTPYIIYYCYGYNFRSIGSKNSYGTSNPPGTTDANYTYSQSGNSLIPITRQSSNGGDLFYYRLEVIAYTTVGTGSAPTGSFANSSIVTTNVIRNNATNRANSPVNIYGAGSG